MSRLRNQAPDIYAARDAWYLDQQTQAQIEAIEANQAVERERLSFAKQKYDEILNLYKSSLNDNSFSDILDPFKQNIDLFAKGGEYGAGAKAETAKAANEAIAAGQLNLASTGMSSGTNVAGLQARVLADKGVADANIEDQRITNLSNALTSYGQAGLSAKSLSQQEQLALLASLR